MMQHRLLIEALEAAPADARRLLRPLPAQALTWKDGDDWSMAEIVTHLANIDLIFGPRFHLIVEQDRPTFRPVDPAVTLSIDALPESDLSRWQESRATICAWLAGLHPGDWNRQATHATRGPITLRSEVQMIVNHDTEHLAQMTETRRVWEKGHKQP
jgi:hypothetical protein